MKKMRVRGIVLSAATVMVGTNAVLLSPSAYAEPDDCDTYGVLGQFRAVGSGASFSFNGRRIELQNERILDDYSRAEIKSGRRSGDLVWADRSLRLFPSSYPSGIVDRSIAEGQGWKQCGPFTGGRTQSVNNRYYAARACARIDGISVCGRWYID